MAEIPQPYRDLLTSLWRSAATGPVMVESLMDSLPGQRMGTIEWALWQLEGAGLSQREQGGWTLTGKGLEALVRSGVGRVSPAPPEQHAGALSYVGEPGSLTLAGRSDEAVYAPPSAQDGSSGSKVDGAAVARCFLWTTAILLWSILIGMVTYLSLTDQYFRSWLGLP